MVSLSDVKSQREFSCQWYIISMMSGHGANPILFNEKKTTPPLQSGRHMCITPRCFCPSNYIWDEILGTIFNVSQKDSICYSNITLLSILNMTKFGVYLPRLLLLSTFLMNDNYIYILLLLIVLYLIQILFFFFFVTYKSASLSDSHDKSPLR